jgi:UDP-glucose 4-epimerase
VKRFVFSSSAAIYGVTGSGPVDEDAPKNPLNSYGETKLTFERILRWYARAYGWSVFAFRYFSAAGATADHGERHQPETHLIPLVLEAAAGERDCFNIYGDDYETPDGTCLRDFVHVSDIANAHIRALKHMKKPGFHCYNIGTGMPYSVRQIVTEAERLTGQRIDARVAGRRPGDPGILYASPLRMMTELGWRPEHSSMQEILQSAWQWKQKQLAMSAAAAASR